MLSIKKQIQLIDCSQPTKGVRVNKGQLAVMYAPVGVHACDNGYANLRKAVFYVRLYN